MFAIVFKSPRVSFVLDKKLHLLAVRNWIRGISLLSPSSGDRIEVNQCVMVCYQARQWLRFCVLIPVNDVPNFFVRNVYFLFHVCQIFPIQRRHENLSDVHIKDIHDKGRERHELIAESREEVNWLESHGHKVGVQPSRSVQCSLVLI